MQFYVVIGQNKVYLQSEMKLAEMEKKNHAALKLRKNKRKRLVTGTVPVNKKYLTGTVDACAHGGGVGLVVLVQ